MEYKSTEKLKSLLEGSRMSGCTEERQYIALEIIAECLIDIRDKALENPPVDINRQSSFQK